MADPSVYLSEDHLNNGHHSQLDGRRFAQHRPERYQHRRRGEVRRHHSANNDLTFYKPQAIFNLKANMILYSAEYVYYISSVESMTRLRSTATYDICHNLAFLTRLLS